MKNAQTVLVGVFLIIFAIATLSYWILLPDEYKETILNEVYLNAYNISFDQLYGNISNESTKGVLLLKDLYLTPRGYNLIISQNSIIGEYIPVYSTSLGDMSFTTNFFHGDYIKTIKIKYNKVLYDGLRLSGNIKCENCELEIYLNNKTVFTTDRTKKLDVLIKNTDLQEDNILKIVVSPKFNPIKNSVVQISDFKISPVKLTKIEYTFYNPGTRLLLEYNFCPTPPSVVEVYINGKKVMLPDCSSYIANRPIDITFYLKDGWNTLSATSYSPTNISLSLYYDSDRFSIPFEKPEIGLLYLVVGKGAGRLYINNRQFEINRSVTMINIRNVTYTENILIIEPSGGDLFIQYLKII